MLALDCDRSRLMTLNENGGNVTVEAGPLNLTLW